MNDIDEKIREAVKDETAMAIEQLKLAQPFLAKAVEILQETTELEQCEDEERDAVRVLCNAERALLHATDYFGS